MQQSRTIPLSVGILLLLAGASLATAETLQFRAMTYNTHHTQAGVNGFAQILFDAGADVVGLNETTAANAAAIASRLSTLTGDTWTSAAAPGSTDIDAVVSRYPILSSQGITLDSFNDFYGDTRTCLEVSIGVPDSAGQPHSLQFFTTHLSIRTPADPNFPAPRSHQVQQVVDFAAGFPAPRILVGDLNLDDSRGGADLTDYQKITGAGYTDSFRQWNPTDPGKTTEVPNPDRRFDYVFYTATAGLTATASDRLVNSATSSSSDHYPVWTDFNWTVSSSGPPPLPAPWQGMDIGAVDLPGSASYSSGTFTVTAGGTDIWDTADAFYYVYQPLNGDGTIVADVSGLTNPAGATFSLAGVMIREKLTTNAVHATMMITNDGKAKFRRRTTEGGTTASDGPSAGTTYPPRWLKLTRQGNVFSAYLSTDGSSWTPVFTPQTIPMAANAYVGFLALRNGSGAPAASATFGGVSVTTPPIPAPWQGVDVGAVGIPGSESYSASTFTVRGGGSDIWDTADAFHFVYQPLHGDGTIVADVTGLSVPAGAAWSLAAVMIREKLTANAVHASMMITTDGKAKFRRRTTEGGTTASDGPSAGSTYPPRWLKLSRAGDTFTAWISTDGSTWTPVFTPQTIPMAADVYVGLVALRNGSSTDPATATFGGVSVTSP